MNIVEYAVRSKAGGRTELIPAVDRTVMRQLAAALAGGGCAVEPVTRVVSDWEVDQTAATEIRRTVARERVLSAAQRYWEQEIDEAAAMAELRPLHPGLAEHKRAELLGELVSELEHQEDVEDRRVAPAPGEDRESMREVAEQMVRDAADKLIGEA